jgi:hypothetical protein
MVIAQVNPAEVPMKYTRIYADFDGETHFEDVEEKTQKTETAPTAFLNLTKPKPASECFLASIPPGYTDDFHPPPKRFVFTILTGEFETTVSDGKVRRFGPGDVALIDDLVSKGHKSTVVSQSDCEFLFVVLAE